MFSYNKVQIIGYQTQPVAVRQTPTGTSVTDLNIVVPYRFKAESGEMLDGKGFHTVTLWGAMAEVAGKFLKPGAQLFISGRLQTDSWEDEKTNEKKSKTKIVGMDMIMLDPKDGQLPTPASAPSLTQCLNRADVIGNLTRDPEMRTTTSGQQVLTIGVATNEKWKDRQSGQDKERSEFHNVVVWGALAEEVARTLKKGNRVMVTGRVQTRSWETKEGSKRYTTEIIADTVAFLGIKNAAVTDFIQSSGASTGASNSMSQAGPEQSYNQDAPTPNGTGGQAEVPTMAYASEIKPEDLPF